MSSVLSKLHSYCSASIALGSANVTGFPFLPKKPTHLFPYNRENYNQFIVWLDRIDLPDAKLILDVGANHGDFAGAASAVFPDASIWLFEPLPELHGELRLRSQVHKNRWKIFPHALGSEKAILQLHIDPEHDDIASLVGFNDSYLENNPKSENLKQGSCEVIPLDDYFENFSERGIDLMKIDVEGFEFEVMKGATKALKQTRALIIEVSLVRAGNRDGSRLVRMLELLESSGLIPMEIIPSWFSKNEPWLPLEFNILARRSN